jgi:hypothetical protein
MFQPTGFNMPSQIQSEINNYMRHHEPPLEDQLFRVLTSLSNEMYESYFNMQNIRFLSSSDKNKERYLLILPCTKISNNLLDMLDQIMAKFNYKRLNNYYDNNLKEYNINYKI